MFWQEIADVLVREKEGKGHHQVFCFQKKRVSCLRNLPTLPPGINNGLFPSRSIPLISVAYLLKG